MHLASLAWLHKGTYCKHEEVHELKHIQMERRLKKKCKLIVTKYLGKHHQYHQKVNYFKNWNNFKIKRCSTVSKTERLI